MTTDESLAAAVANLAATLTRLNKSRSPDEEVADALNALCDRSYLNSLEHGFHDHSVDVGIDGWEEQDSTKIALMHSELSEALEELRSGHLPDEHYYRGHGGVEVQTFRNEDGSLNKPEGVPSELVDVIIRIADYCGWRGIDLGRALTEKALFNETRSRMNGGKRF